MNCHKAGDLISAYIEGEVAGRQSAALEAHLSGCAGCHEELETLRSALALLAVPKTLVRPEGLLEEFKAKYLPEAETATAPRWGFRVPVLPKIEWPSLSRLMLPMGSMAAAGAAAALIVALHGQPSGPRTASAGHSTAPTKVAASAISDNTVSETEGQSCVAGNHIFFPDRAAYGSADQSGGGSGSLAAEWSVAGGQVG